MIVTFNLDTETVAVILLALIEAQKISAIKDDYEKARKEIMNQLAGKDTTAVAPI